MTGRPVVTCGCCTNVKGTLGHQKAAPNQIGSQLHLREYPESFCPLSFSTPVCIVQITLCRRGSLGPWSYFTDTGLVGGEVAPRQGSTCSLLVVRKGTMAAKSPFAVRVSSDSLNIFLEFILHVLCIEKLHLMVK